MRKIAISIYPGYITKGLKGRLIWHPKLPSFSDRESDWESVKPSVDLSDCISDPWPYSGGGPDCIIEVKAV